MVRDVAAWLERLGLARYAEAFERNEIDFDTLPHLTEPMLEKIGVPLGPRAKLLAAITDRTSLPAASTQALEDRFQVEQEQAERRQITAMFCDLVDSTKLAGLLDPEEFGLVMQSFQQSCGEVVQRHGGHISQYRGDALEVYFNWPVAHEDAAERAVRAALEVIEAVKAIPARETLSTRIGICSGVVVVSQKGADGDPAQPSGAVGETLHLASRMQTLALPDGVVISESTNRLISGRFDKEDLGAQRLKGVAEPIRAYRVHGVREDASRFDVARPDTLTPLVGRNAELFFLQQLWREAKQGEGQVVFISGVAGIGKSRIVHELEKWIGPRRRLTLRFQCLPHCVQSALFPVIQRVERLAEIADDDTDIVRLGKIEAMLSRAMHQPETAIPVIVEMMSLPRSSRYSTLALTPQQIKAQALRVLTDLLIEIARTVPLLCVLEDAHWIDPSTQELLELVIGRLDKSRILLIVTHRPEYQLPAGTQGHASSLTVTRLGRRDAAEMARLALRDRAVSTAVVDRIVSGSDSIPLFLEELARGAADSTSAERNDPPSADTTVPLWLVPETLRDALIARLDRAPDARKVAQLAAVIGREFSYELLCRLSPLSNDELLSALQQLMQSDIIQARDGSLHSRFVFRHALLRDAAYESLLKSARRENHAKVAEIIAKSPDVISGQPELIAYHYDLAGHAELAVHYWTEGGHRALSRSANIEASILFEKALQSLRSFPSTPERIATELDIHLSLGLCCIEVKGYSASATRQAFERAYELTQQIREPRKEIQALFGQWGHFWMKAQHDRAIELGRALLAMATPLQDQAAIVLGHRCIGSTLFTLGEFVQARSHLERGLVLGEQSAKGSLSVDYAVDPTIAARLMLAWDLWVLGYPAQARCNVLQALTQATDKSHPYTLAFAHYVTSAVHLLCGEVEHSLDHATQSLAISGEHQINLYALYARFGRGCAFAKLGRKEHAIAEIRGAIEEAKRSELGYMRGFMLGELASAQCEAGDPETALSTLDEALRQVNDVSGRAWESELLRLHGDALLASGRGDEITVETRYNDAISLARKQQARSLELRATSSLARLLRTQRRSDEARARLAGILEWFTEGHDTADLLQARRLLLIEKT